MTTIELSTGTLLVLALPDDELTPMGVDLNGFDFLGHPSEITGEVWGMVVEFNIIVDGNGHTYCEYYKDYTNPQQVVSSDYNLDTFLQSGLSLCAAHNIKESDVLLFKPKNS